MKLQERRINALLRNTQKHKQACIENAHKIIRSARRIHTSAQNDADTASERLHSASGQDREIFEAEYMHAVDARNKALKAELSAQETLKKLGAAKE